MSATIRHPLDDQGLFHLVLSHDADRRTLSARLEAPEESGPEFLERLNELVTVVASSPSVSRWHGMIHPGETLELISGDIDLSLKIDRQKFGQYFVNAEHGISGKALHRLTTFETRMLGRHLEDAVPYKREDIPEELIPQTDLHTHLSAQVSSRDLIRIGMERESGATLYPTRFLDELGIDYSNVQHEKFRTIPYQVFIPLSHLPHPETETAVPLDALAPKALKKLEDNLHFPPDRQSTYPEMELKIYRMREPMTKDLALLPPMLECIAEDYRNNGVKYAELQTTSLVKPEWLRKIHEVVPEIEERTGVQLRFLQQIPRSLHDEQIDDYIEKTKVIAASPYVAGVNFVGYEVNKTSHIADHIREIARWAHESQPDFIIGVHAGETGKNLSNVREVLEIGREFNVRLRIGHMLYGVDRATLKLAHSLSQDGLLAAEILPASNMAINNVDAAADVPVHALARAKVAFILSSDGAGIYLTSPEQLAQIAMFAGATKHDLKKMRDWEDAHVERQQLVFDRKQAAFPKDFFETLRFPPPRYTPGIAAQYAAEEQKKNRELEELLDSHGIIRHPDEIEKALAGKRVFGVFGAAGSRWKDIDDKDQREIEISAEMLVQALDPRKTAFFVGRTKNDGVMHAVNDAVRRHNIKATPEERFIFLSYFMKERKAVESITADALTHMVLAKGSVLTLQQDMMQFAREHRGMLDFTGGGTFTRDMILLASQQKDMPFGLWIGPNGASTGKAWHMDESHRFEDARGRVRFWHAKEPQLFRADFDIRKLDHYYRIAAQQIGKGAKAER